MNSVPSRRTLALLVLVCLLVPAGALTGHADTDVTFVEDDVTESTTWTAEGGPYRIAEDITVREGATLTIEPGTAVQPAEGVTVTVRGNLTANGTAGDPITFTTAPQAPEDIRWGSIRYDGTARSRLSLSNVTIAAARNGVTVTSPRGTVTVASSTVRDVERNGVKVARTGGTPRITVRDSTFARIGSRGVLFDPGTGAIADSRIVAQREIPQNVTAHNVSVTPRADTTFRTVRFEYDGYGDVTQVDEEEIPRLGIDNDTDREVERFYNETITSVRHPEPDVLEVTVAQPITVPAETSLVANYTNVTNPETFGTYPVEVRLQAHGVDQLAPTALPLRIGESPARTPPAWNTQRSHASGFTISGSTFRSIGQQGVFVAAGVASNFRVAENTLEDVRGSGVAIRARRVNFGRIDGNRLAGIDADSDGIRVGAQRITDSTVRRNRITGVDDGIRLVTRDDGADEVRVASNEVTNSTTGLRVHGATNRLPTRLSMAVVDNTFSENRRHGVHVTGEHARFASVEMRENELAGNGRAGLRMDARLLAHSTLANNTVADNDAAGVRVTNRQVRETRIVDNEVAENGGHGLSIRTYLAVHNVSVGSNRVLDNARVGLDLHNRLTHAGRLTVAENTVAANAYGVRVAGSLGARVRNNTIVHNTYGLGNPVRIPGYEPGTGVVVEEGSAGALFEATAVRDELDRLVDGHEVEEYLPPDADDPYTVVLRSDPNETDRIEWNDDAALAVESLSADIPTGVALASDDDRRSSVAVVGNDVYGHGRGMVVNVGALVDGNTTTRLLVDATRTVTAEHNYWGAPDGPTHSSIHPEGTGDRVVTEHGWVDFLPSAESPHEPRHYRPDPVLTVAPDPARPGETVVVSARNATDRDGSVATYQFGNDQSTFTTTDPTFSTAFEVAGNYSISLVVEDDMGIESAARARATISVREPPETTTVERPPETTTVQNETTTATTATTTTETTTVQNGTTTTTKTPDSSSETGPLDALFSSIGGLTGLAFYGAGLALGAYGTFQTLFAGTVTVSGRTVNGLAAAGVLTWVGFGLLGTDGLLVAGLGGVVLWIGLVALLWVVTRVLG